MLATVSRTRLRFMTWWTSLNALTGDGLLYLLAAGFALVLGESSTQAAQWQWGYLAMGPYALAALLSFVLARYVVRRQHLVRVVLFSVVVVGAIAAPLGLEAHWRHAQPEVGVIARAGELISKGQDPYHTYDEHGRLVGAIKDLPKFESFFPYFPLMGAFGLPSAETHKGKGLTDARIIMTLMSIIVSGWALALLRASKEQKTSRGAGLDRSSHGRAVLCDRRRRHADSRAHVARGRRPAAAPVQSRRHQFGTGRRDEDHGLADGGGRLTRRA